MKTTVIFNARLVDANSEIFGAIVVRGGRIVQILPNVQKKEDAIAEVGEGAETIDANGLVLMPAFVDMHAHFRDPGQTEKEDLQSGLLAAEAGGFGTVVLMPNTSPVISEISLAKKIMDEAAQKSKVKVFQTVSLTRDFGGEDTSHLDSLDSSQIPVISEDGRDVRSSAIMLEAMKKAAKAGAIVACHCEDIDLAAEAKKLRSSAISILKNEGIFLGKYENATPDFLKNGKITEKIKEAQELFSKAHSILALAEDVATERNLRLAQVAGCKIHICHCSTAQSLEAVRRAKKAGVRVTCEVTPHHVALSLDKFPFADFALVNPPIRKKIDVDAILNAINDGTVDCISTDHAPHTQNDKAAGAPGFPGLETAFSVLNSNSQIEIGNLLYSLGFKNSSIPPEETQKVQLRVISKLMSENPAKILNLNEGLLQRGFDAKFVLVDPEERWIVNPNDFKTKGRSSPFASMELCGKVKKTLLL